MSTATSPVRTAAPVLRPTWARSLVAAALGVAAGGLASAALIGATVVGISLAGGGPIEDAIGNALRPLAVFMLVPIVAAVLLDAVCRREVFWLVTGRRPSFGTAAFAALIAPAAAIGVGWRGGVVVYVLGVSTVLLRCCAQPTALAPRQFAVALARRPRAVLAGLAAAVVLVAAAGLAAFQLATPAVAFSGMAYTTGGVGSARDVQVTNRSLGDVTVLGLDGPLGEIIRIGGPGAPFSLPRGETRSISLMPAPSCTSGDASFSAIGVRYRMFGIERVSSLDLGGEIRIRC